MVVSRKKVEICNLRLRKTTMKRLRDWKVAIEKAHHRKYSWDEFIDICLFDLEIIDIPGAKEYKKLQEGKGKLNI